MSEPLSEEEEARWRADVEAWIARGEGNKAIQCSPYEESRLLATLDQARERIAVLEDEASYLADKVADEDDYDAEIGPRA